MKSSIALIGFMGVGKTAVGKALASALGKTFVELDALIEQRAGKSIPEIFKADGEIAFREMEIGAVKVLAGRKDMVIACGGGVVLNKININRLKLESVILLLTASPDTIMNRTSQDGGGRPLLNDAPKASDIQELLSCRRPFYERAADIKMSTSRLSIDTIVKKIIKKLKDYEGFAK